MAAGLPRLAPPAVFDWLLEPDQPAIQYRTLREVLGRDARDPDVVAARDRIATVGWAADILSERAPEGWWVDGESLYRPKYLATNWKLLVLADLGLTRAHPAVELSARLWMDRFAGRDGGFGGSPGSAGHLCINGNTARALVQFGFDEDPRVRSAYEWLVRSASPLGGWSCFGRGRNLDSWEGLSAFAVYPRDRWTGPMRDAVARGAEFFLERRLLQQGTRYPPWYRLHYPVHYYYDVLVGLDVLTALGYGADPRLEDALGVLQRRRRSDGRWNLDAAHPDVGGAVARWFESHPKQRPTPWSLESPGRPSKMITLRALTVLRRVRDARAQGPRGPGVPRTTGRARSSRRVRSTN